jgi:hypothetical protein
MAEAIRKRVRVQPGGRIEFTDPRLREGVEVTVSVSVFEAGGAPTAPHDPDDGWDAGMLTYEELEALPPLPLDQILGSAPSGRTAEEVDRDLRALRDEWDEPFARRS